MKRKKVYQTLPIAIHMYIYRHGEIVLEGRAKEESTWGPPTAHAAPNEMINRADEMKSKSIPNDALEKNEKSTLHYI